MVIISWKTKENIKEIETESYLLSYNTSKKEITIFINIYIYSTCISFIQDIR